VREDAIIEEPPRATYDIPLDQVPTTGQGASLSTTVSKTGLPLEPTPSRDVLAEMEAFQREIDELRERQLKEKFR